MKRQPTDRWDQETTLVFQVAAFTSLLSFLFYFRHGDLLLYGDAVAHINIARRVFDSRTPGLLQLGTVWLPLPHLLMVPFLLSDSGWQTGIAGSIPSLVSFVLGTAGVYRLVRSALSGDAKPSLEVRISAWLAAVIYAANPNLIYLQTTAMTEPLYLAFFIWEAVHFTEFVQDARENRGFSKSSLLKCGWCLLGACLTRYDGWFLAATIVTLTLFIWIKYRQQSGATRAFTKFLLLAAAGPLLWLAYNAAVYRNPLEFANGPYSARAIEQKSATAAMPSRPGSHDLRTAMTYFLKSAELNVAESNWHRLWLLLLLSVTLAVLFFAREHWPVLLLCTPVPFYMLCIAYAGVPVFVPVWWPFSSYNVRYGLEMLPAFAVFAALAVHASWKLTNGRWAKVALIAAALSLAGVSYASIWRAQPVCYREAWVNSRSRIALESALASNLQLFPHDATFLMYLGDHVGALQRAGIPLRRVINEGNHRTWKSPQDPQGLWERSLAHPQQYVDYVIACDGDPVASYVERRDLQSVIVLRTTGQPACTIYWTRRPLGNHAG